MATDFQHEAEGAIRYRVWSGWYDPEEAFDFVSDDLCDFDEEDFDEAWLRKAIRAEFRKKRAAEKLWPKPTTFERLDAVFETLKAQGILTWHRCGLTIQDGLNIVHGEYEDAGGTKSQFHGYCFYHLQDMEGAMGSAGLRLAFGSFPFKDNLAVLVGSCVRTAFVKAKFKVKWDGTADTRILLKGFKWQRRSPK